MRNGANILKYKLAVAGLRNSADPLKLAHAVRHLGDAYYYAGQMGLAEPCYVEALSIYRRHDNAQPLDVANAIRSYAVLKSELDRAEEARLLWKEAHGLYLSVNVSAGVAETAARLALLAQTENDLPQCREWLAEATQAAELADDPETSQSIAEITGRLEAR